MSRQPSSCRHFEFIFHAEGDSALTKAQVYAYLKCVATRAVFQLEGGVGYVRRWQGLLESPKRTRVTTLRNVFTALLQLPVGSVMSLTPCTEGKRRDYRSLPRYSTALDTRIEGPYFLDFNQCIADVSLRAFQKSILESGTWPDDGTINCIVDSGDDWKATVAALVQIQKKGFYIPHLMDSSEQLMQAVYLALHGDDAPQIIIYDVVDWKDWRTSRNILRSLELIKSGVVYDSANAGHERRFNSPQVWVFTKRVPDSRFLTPAKWRFLAINDLMSRGFGVMSGNTGHSRQEAFRQQTENTSMGDEDTRWFGYVTGSPVGRELRKEFLEAMQAQAQASSTATDSDEASILATDSD